VVALPSNGGLGIVRHPQFEGEVARQSDLSMLGTRLLPTGRQEAADQRGEARADAGRAYARAAGGFFAKIARPARADAHQALAPGAGPLKAGGLGPRFSAACPASPTSFSAR
jgi:hypothetical protein